jgi:hypothetical protein
MIIEINSKISTGRLIGFMRNICSLSLSSSMSSNWFEFDFTFNFCFLNLEAVEGVSYYTGYRTSTVKIEGQLFRRNFFFKKNF